MENEHIMQGMLEVNSLVYSPEMSTVDVDAVLGRTAALPCDVTPDTKEDRVYMVLWFRAGKATGGKPIYSFDVRGRSFNKALQWSDPHAFGPRAYFATVARPASLTLDTVQLDDEGVYRCRVDFKNSPTRNFQIRLHVIVPPHQLILYDKSGRDVSGVVGPLEEGNELVLVCEVRGGRWGSDQHMLTRVCNSGLTSEMQQPTLEPRGPAQSAPYDDTACNTWRGI
ncbi:unnamed protein product [Plutella xylostella]|uniref:(diamondback moth) hypothetical protein n=1 Tax=Plutella xylostella TaxID=51655 RepID=A0A8S4GC15_PLUXY|nr:unnamed protein product [Plutella xylostella]